MPTNPTNPTKFTMAVTIDHRQGFKLPTRSRRCRLRSFPQPDPTLLDIGRPSPNFPRSFSTPCLSTNPVATAADEAAAANNVARVEIIGSRRAYGVHTLVVEASIALASGSQPVRASGGLGGAYILHNRDGESFAVVKPVNDGPGRFSGVLSHPALWRPFRAAETAVREAAAYLLDHGGFSSVPATALVKITHPVFHTNVRSPVRWRIASIQQFVRHDFDAGELGPSCFSITSVHRIGILDVRLLNVDRHAGNILVKKSPCGDNDYDGHSNDRTTELVPIDHGLCLPEVLDDPYFEWLHWPQAALPFSDVEADYISSLDPFKDAELLRSELPFLKEASIRILVLCTIFLKGAAAAGLCLADIGGMMTREFGGVEEGPSALEALCKEVEESMNDSMLVDDGSAEKDECRNEHQKVFLFDMDREDAIDIPQKATSSCSQALGCDQCKFSFPLQDEDGDSNDGDGDGDDDNKNEKKIGGITKSVSFSATSFNYDRNGGGSGSRCISFKGLSEEEWVVFLERFEELLPEAFEARKSIGLKQRLGISCRF